MANHRAEKRALTRRGPVDSGSASGTSKPPPGGRRRAEKPVRAARSVPGLPSAPTLVGASALVLAAAGSLTVGSTAPASSTPTAAHTGKYGVQASALSGSTSGSVSNVSSSSELLDRRKLAVSRDSRRDAVRDAADQSLQAAAEKRAKERDAALAALAASAEKQAGLIAKDSWQLPVATGAYHLTSRFGECSSLWSHCHTGLDFAAPSGTPVRAVANGTVTEVGSAGAYGNRTIVTLEDGTELWYCHQTSFSVTTGQQVRAGELIGQVGSTGNVTGPHLHLEVRPGAGDPVDPDSALVEHGLHP